METEALLLRLDSFLQGKSGQIEIEANNLKAILTRVKALERALADTLAFAYESNLHTARASTRRQKASPR